MEQRQAIDWEQLLDIIERENSRPAHEGWIREEYLLPIPHQAIAMVPDLAPWTWTEPQPQPEPEPQPEPQPAPQPGRRLANTDYFEWVAETSMDCDMYQCLCKWCTTTWREMKGHKCHLCQHVYFDDASSFNEHLKLVHGKTWPPKCSWFSCRVEAKDQDDLTQHINNWHMDAAPFKCNRCGINCRTVYVAKNHCT